MSNNDNYEPSFKNDDNQVNDEEFSLDIPRIIIMIKFFSTFGNSPMLEITSNRFSLSEQTDMLFKFKTVN